MNVVTLYGRIATDIKTGRTQNDKFAAKFSVAVKNMNDTDFIPCDIFGKQAETIAQYFSKGSRIALSGRLNTYSYEDKKTGEKKYGFNVLVNNFSFVDTKAESSADATNAPQVQSASVYDNDDIPF